MEILSLKTFRAIIDEGGIRGASELLNTVPSNITARIQKLEDELGTKLFQLVGRKLELTANGHLLSEYAIQILKLEYQATAAIQNSSGNVELRIGTPETFAAVHIPSALQRLKRKHPNIRPKILTGTSSELMQAVLNNKVDCAAIGNAGEHKALNVIPVIEEELVLVTPAAGDHDAVLFVRDLGCGYRQWALNWQQQAGKSGEEVMVMSSADGILGCIAAGLGYTVIGRDMVRGSRYEKDLHVRAAMPDRQSVKISLVYQKNNPLESSIQSLAGLIRRPDSAIKKG